MKITHVNHSSVLIENQSGKFIWTDPWVISPAFDGWTQKPHPYTKIIKKITDIPRENLKIIISHGHDDHLDEFILSSESFKEVEVIIPKLNTPGLRKRIENLSKNRKVIEVDKNDYLLDGFRITNLINPDYTGDDTIFLIDDTNTTFIHANDNYHEYSLDFCKTIQGKLNFYNSNIILYAVQIAMADSFPYIYEPLSLDEKNEILLNGHKKRVDAVKQNMENLGFNYAYIYANQASFLEKIQENKDIKNSSLVKDEFIDLNSNRFLQLKPSFQYTFKEELKHDHFLFESSVEDSTDTNIFEFLLKKYNDKARKYVQNKIPNPIFHDFRFSSFEDEKNNQDFINFKSEKKIWQNILTGKHTLESIIVGGNGLIIKPKDINISPLIFCLTKWTYKVQSELNRKE